MSKDWGMVTISAGVRAFADVGAGGLSGVLLGNESPLKVTVTLQGANTSRSLYPGTVDWFPIPKGASFNGMVQLDPVSTLSNASSWPSSYLQIDTFGPGERPEGTYPMALPRNTNVGNTVSTAMGGANTLQNDGNTQTVIIESTPSGAPSSTISIDNEGNVTVKGNNAGTLTTLLQLIAGASPAVKLAAAAVLTEALGNLKVDGTLESAGAATLDSTLTVDGSSILDNGTITTDGSGNINKLKSILFSGAGVNVLGYDSAGDILSVTGSANSRDMHYKATATIWFEPGAGQVAKVDGSGIHLVGGFLFDLGSTGTIKTRNGNTIQAVSSFDGTTTGTYNHGFGASPFWVIPMCKVSGSQTMGFDSVTSSQVHITSFSGLGFRTFCFA